MALLVLAAVGAVLPLLPSTPFLILSASCFARTSSRWNERLLNLPLFGRALHDWRSNRCVRPSTKAVAILAMVVGSTATMCSATFNGPLLVGFILAMTTAAIIVLRIPSKRGTPLQVVAGHHLHPLSAVNTCAEWRR